MELAPGASCPVTLLWTPKNNGPVSTDLIIRHSGRMGFAVIPVRGVAKGGAVEAASSSAGGGKNEAKDSVPLPMTAQQIEKEMAGKIAPVPDTGLGMKGGGGDGGLHLIGTVGERAVMLMPNGMTQILPMGGEFTYDGKKAKIVAVGARSIDVVAAGKRTTMSLEAAQSLISQATADDAANAAASGHTISGSVKR